MIPTRPTDPWTPNPWANPAAHDRLASARKRSREVLIAADRTGTPKRPNLP